MSNQFHDEMSGSDIHVINAFTYVDAAARDGASGLTVNDEGKVALQQNDRSYWVLTDHTVPTWKQITSGVISDENVKVSANDSTTGKLVDKVSSSGIATVTEANDGGNETLNIHVPNTNTDQNAKVSANDTTSGLLKDKIVSGSGISVTEVNEGGNETLRIETTGGGVDSDEKVKASANDTTARYLLEKILAGTNITIDENNDGGDETITINANASGGSGAKNHFWRWYPTRRDDSLELASDDDDNDDWAVDERAQHGTVGGNCIWGYRFDDDEEEGVGAAIFIPAGATNITIRFRSRAASSPSGSRKVALDMYYQPVPDGGDLGSWGSKKAWDNIVTMSDNDWHYHEATKTLASQGVTADQMYIFELVRDGGGTNDDLNGDWYLGGLEIEFS